MVESHQELVTELSWSLLSLRQKLIEKPIIRASNYICKKILAVNVVAIYLDFTLYVLYDYIHK